jgi:hypothetical protein
MIGFSTRAMGMLILLLLLSFSLQAGSPEAPAPLPPAALDEKALSEMELQHSRARDFLMATEARLSLIAEQLFNSRLTVDYAGEIEPPFRLAFLEMDLDGHLAYRQEFGKAPSAQRLKLFDGFLPPGRHTIQLRLFARGPDDPEDSPPSYTAGSGMAIVLPEQAICQALFEAEENGDAPTTNEMKRHNQHGNWDVEFHASYAAKRTEKSK